MFNFRLTRCVDQDLVDIRAVDREKGGADALARQFGHLFAVGGNPQSILWHMVLTWYLVQ